MGRSGRVLVTGSSHIVEEMWERLFDNSEKIKIVYFLILKKSPKMILEQESNAYKYNNVINLDNYYQHYIMSH